MTKACVSFLPLYYAFNFIRCIKFKYCVFTTFKLYYLRRKGKNQPSVFPQSCSSFTVRVEINDMQPNAELVIKWNHYPVWLVFIKLWEPPCKRSLKAPPCISEGWCSAITGVRKRSQRLQPLHHPNWAIHRYRLELWFCPIWVETLSSSRQIKDKTKGEPCPTNPDLCLSSLLPL